MPEKTKPEREYIVHAFKVVRVKVPGIMAASHEEAIEKAEEAIGRLEFGNYRGLETEDAEETSHYLLDDAEQVRNINAGLENDHSKSVWFCGDGQTPMPTNFDRPSVIVQVGESHVRSVLCDRKMRIVACDETGSSVLEDLDVQIDDQKVQAILRRIEKARQ